jgi:hypothetical protein
MMREYKIQPVLGLGFHVSRTITFAAPATPAKQALCLILGSSKNEVLVFVDDQVRITVNPVKSE